MSNLIIDGYNLKIQDIINITNNNLKVKLSKNSIIKINKSREVVEKIISNNHVIYGINTGFGSLSSVTIDADKLGDLQSNLIRSHACGVGDKMENNHVLMMMLVRAQFI